MAFIEWSDDMSVGVEVLDDDHRVIILLLNELYEAMVEGEGRAAMGFILDSLVNYTTIHFEREEKAFEKTDYPDIEAHKRLHKTLIKQVLDIQEKHNNSIFLMSMEVLDFLKRWLLDHIQGTDKKYEPYLNISEAA